MITRQIIPRSVTDGSLFSSRFATRIEVEIDRRRKIELSSRNLANSSKAGTQMHGKENEKDRYGRKVHCGDHPRIRTRRTRAAQCRRRGFQSGAATHRALRAAMFRPAVYCAALAVLPPFEVEGSSGRAPRYAVNNDEFRLWPSIDVDGREELPFHVAREILLKVSLSPGFTIHYAFALTPEGQLGNRRGPCSRVPVS